MDKQRILKEAQKIASKFSFWMVSGNIAHLYGYVYETPEKKYELEIKFDESFPDFPPHLTFHEDIKELLGDFKLETLNKWETDSHVVDIIHELKAKIQQALHIPKIEDQPLIPIVEVPEQNKEKKEIEHLTSDQTEEYLTPDLNAYPPDFNYEQYLEPSEEDDSLLIEPEADHETSEPEIYEEPPEIGNEPIESQELTQAELYANHEETSVTLNTEISLIQQEYAYDQPTHQKGDLNIYLTITITKTFIIHININDYPERPVIEYPEEITGLLGDPYQNLATLRDWNSKNPNHVVDILHELEGKLYFIKDIETESKKILGEYQCDFSQDDITKLKVHLVTYGFKEYIMDVNLDSYPKQPSISLSSELQTIIRSPISELKSYTNWVEKESEPVEIVREIAWLVDKNSRINFELELLKEHYKDIDFDISASVLKVDMKGKMKTQDLVFKFQIDLPIEYPMKVPTIKILNEFEIETHEKIKNDLQSSFKDFFEEWTPFSYLVDLFNAISKKIFEVSVVSCVICHKIDCPTCSLKIAGPDAETCHVDCPYCERSYHKHCWDQTIKSFGKCGFCLKTPPPSMMPY